MVDKGTAIITGAYSAIFSIPSSSLNISASLK
jgi:hypothetical protein